MPKDDKISPATLKAIKKPSSSALIAWCPMCGEDHHHTEGTDCYAGIYAPQCRDGAGSPYAGYRLEVTEVASLADGVDLHAPFVRRRRPGLWQQFHGAAGKLQALAAALILQRARPVTIFDSSLPGRGADPFELIGTRWAYGPHRGEDLATAAAQLYGATPGIVAVRAFEALLGIRLDAQGFVETQAAIDGFYARGAKRGEGRRA